MHDENDLTAEGLWRRVAGKRAVADHMVESKAFCLEAYNASGCAVEFALKAIIVQKRGWNAWPSRTEFGELYTHNLRLLFKEAGVDLQSSPPAIRAKLRQVLDWTRGHEYYAKKMPRVIAKNMFEAVFGEGGVIEWLRTKE